MQDFQLHVARNGVGSKLVLDGVEQKWVASVALQVAATGEPPELEVTYLGLPMVAKGEALLKLLCEHCGGTLPPQARERWVDQQPPPASASRFDVRDVVRRVRETQARAAVRDDVKSMARQKLDELAQRTEAPTLTATAPSPGQAGPARGYCRADQDAQASPACRRPPGHAGGHAEFPLLEDL